MNKEEIKKANTTGPMVKSSIAETSFLGRLIGKHDFEDHYWSPFLGAAAANRSTTPSLPKRSYLDSICQGSTNQKRRSNKKKGRKKKKTGRNPGVSLPEAVAEVMVRGHNPARAYKRRGFFSAGLPDFCDCSCFLFLVLFLFFRSPVLGIPDGRHTSGSHFTVWNLPL